MTYLAIKKVKGRYYGYMQERYREGSSGPERRVTAGAWPTGQDRGNEVNSKKGMSAATRRAGRTTR